MDINDEEEDPIVGMRMRTNRTSTDHRAALALDAKDLLILRTLCDHVSNDEFADSIQTYLDSLSFKEENGHSVIAFVPHTNILVNVFGYHSKYS